jgi:RNA polymerase sigma-70 factor (ECF subfamily)
MDRGETSAAGAQRGGIEESLWRYQQGDSSAAAELVRTVSPLLYRYCIAQGDRPQEAEDLVQEIWLRIHQARHTYRPGAPAMAWLYAIARHTRIDSYRKRRRIAAREVAVERLPEIPMQQARNGRQPDVGAMLAVLPASQREVLVMLKGAGMSLEEIACATSSTVGAVKQKAFRAYQRLRLLVGDSPGEVR